MDTFAAMALATEAPNDNLLDQKPYNREESILTPVMYRNILGQAILQIALFVSLLIVFRYKTHGVSNGIEFKEHNYSFLSRDNYRNLIDYEMKLANGTQNLTAPPALLENDDCYYWYYAEKYFKS
jgi:magnesium-transporting ATPase (P-type)